MFACLSYLIALYIFAMRLVNWRSVTCYTHQNFKRKSSFIAARNLFILKKKKGFKESYKTSVNIEDLDVYLLTKSMKKLNRNHIEEEDSSELLESMALSRINRWKKLGTRFAGRIENSAKNNTNLTLLFVHKKIYIETAVCLSFRYIC